MSSFVHLCTHSDYSLLRSTMDVRTIAEQAKARGMDAVALTDDSNLFAAPYFFNACKKHDVKPIIGCSFALAAGGIKERGNVYRKSGVTGNIVLLAENSEGYTNLCKLSSASYIEGFYYFPRIDYELMAQYNSNLICLTGGTRGEIAQQLRENNTEQAKETLQRYIDIYGKNNTYVELNNHNNATDELLIKQLLTLAEEMGVEVVATNNCAYLNKEDALPHNALICIGRNRKLANKNFQSDQLYLKTPEEMADLFKDYPQALENTLRIAERCNFDFPFRDPELPDYDIPPGFDSGDSYLKHLCQEGLARRFATVSDALQARMDYELKVIISMGYTGYFLIVWDVIHFAKEHKIPVGPGRGSGAGSLVAYVLEITNIDPIKYKLLFERFLNPSRISMPDFDIDFCMEDRGKIIEYVANKYGTDRVVQIITFGKLKARAALRDVARVLDIPYDEANTFISQIPVDPSIKLPQILKTNKAVATTYKKNETYKQLFDIAMRLEGLNRHASTHAAGIVIAKSNIIDYVPLYKDPRSGAITTQFAMDVLESCGLIKMDFLGLKTLTIIKRAEETLQEEQGDFAIDAIPENDKKTFELLARGDSNAVFQLESEGMQQILKQAQPTLIEDIIAIISLYRPGPLQFVDKYIASKTGKEKISYPLEILKDILEETHGVIIYQEQVMQIVQTVAGFDLAEADILRRVMGKKLAKEMLPMKEKFIEGARANGHKAAVANELFEMLMPFADYGFNKSHAAAYAILAYQTAYLKANYPAAFFAANLSCEIHVPDRFKWFLRQAQQHGVKVLPPDLLSSNIHFTVTDDKVLYGFTGIRNVPRSAAEEIIRVRNEGMFRSVFDFMCRVNLDIVSRRVIMALIAGGCFDGLHDNRAALMNSLEQLRRIALERKESRDSGQFLLFDEDQEEQFFSEQLNKITTYYSREEQARLENEYLYEYFSGHPLDPYLKAWKKFSENINLGNVENTVEGNYTCMGVLRDIDYFHTRKGSKALNAVLADYRGNIEVVLYDVDSPLEALVEGKVYIISGMLEKARRTRIVMKDIEPAEYWLPIHITLNNEPDESELHELRRVLEQSKGHAKVILHIQDKPDSLIHLRIRSKANKDTLEKLSTLACVKESWIHVPR